ncbi:MAG: 4'-phosphopantetheinyl transferase family protein [Gemmatimonadota bacterium]
MSEPVHLQSRVSPPARRVDLWLGDLDRHAGFDGGAALLSVDERARAGRFHRDTDRRRFEAGRGHLRRILGRHLSVPAESIVFRYSETGKPGLDGPGDVGFSVSHSHNLLLIGLGRGVLGVDVELPRPMPDMYAVAGMVFTGKEVDWMNEGSSDGNRERFFRLWTAKESLLKGMGVGFLSDPREVEVSPTPFGFQASPSGRTGESWSMVCFTVGPEIAGEAAYGALAVPGPPPDLRAHRVPGEGTDRGAPTLASAAHPWEGPSDGLPGEPGPSG